jgi:hypothetical protein
MREFRPFDTPGSIVMICDKSLEPATISHFDSGTVINGQDIVQPPVVCEPANISDDMVIMTCIAMGYPNHDFAANRVKSRHIPTRTS